MPRLSGRSHASIRTCEIIKSRQCTLPLTIPSRMSVHLFSSCGHVVIRLWHVTTRYGDETLTFQQPHLVPPKPVHLSIIFRCVLCICSCLSLSSPPHCGVRRRRRRRTRKCIRLPPSFSFHFLFISSLPPSLPPPPQRSRFT